MASLLLGAAVWLSVCRLRGLLEMWVRARLDARAEQEERATMLAVTDALDRGGGAARFADG
ncbi:hypothetical protein [Streptomyces cacaoi]